MGDKTSRTEIPPGTLYMLILKTLSRGPQHGYGISEHIQQMSEEVLQVEEGSLYPALQRMLIKGWVTAAWGQSENNRRARFYRLTASGRKQLATEISEFLFRRARFDRELDEEMQFHLAMKARRNRESGVPAEEAEYAARRNFGNAVLAREHSRDAWSWGAVERLGEDVRYSLRMLRKNPGFTAVATLVPALASERTRPFSAR